MTTAVTITQLEEGIYAAVRPLADGMGRAGPAHHGRAAGSGAGYADPVPKIWPLFWVSSPPRAVR